MGVEEREKSRMTAVSRTVGGTISQDEEDYGRSGGGAGVYQGLAFAHGMSAKPI